jgi:hypothetical protein
MSARVPDWVVCRIWWRGAEEELAMEVDAPNSEEVGMRMEDWTRCMVEGKWPVWKVDFWRRRVPPIDFGSVRVQLVRGLLGKR